MKALIIYIDYYLAFFISDPLSTLGSDNISKRAITKMNDSIKMDSTTIPGSVNACTML
jgi:hypothetical protein